MKFSNNLMCIKIDKSLIFFLLIMLITKNKVFLICYISILIHEFFHLIFIYFYKIKIYKLRFTLFGIECHISNINSLKKEFIIKIVGPMSNIIMAILFINYKLIYTVNMLLFFINIFPIAPLDGYIILKIILKFIKQDNKYMTEKYINIILLMTIYFIGIYFLIKFRNYSLLAFILCVTIKNMQSNIAFCN